MRAGPTSIAALGAVLEGGTFDRRALLGAPQGVADGDLSVRLPRDRTGLEGKIADRFNDIAAADQKMAEELGACKGSHPVGRG
jgi:hypothetical protein